VDIEGFVFIIIQALVYSRVELAAVLVQQFVSVVQHGVGVREGIPRRGDIREELLALQPRRTYGGRRGRDAAGRQRWRWRYGGQPRLQLSQARH
jgi:hypothetical protein